MNKILKRSISFSLAALMFLSCAVFCFAEGEDGISAPEQSYEIDSDYSADHFCYDKHEMVVTFTEPVTEAEAGAFAEEYGLTAVWPYVMPEPGQTDSNVVMILPETASLGESMIAVFSDDRVRYVAPNAPVYQWVYSEPCGFHTPCPDLSEMIPGEDYVDGELLITLDPTTPDIPFSFRLLEDYGCMITSILGFSDQWSAGKVVKIEVINGKTVSEVMADLQTVPYVIDTCPNYIYHIPPEDPEDPSEPFEPFEIKVTRIGGANRYETSFEAAKVMRGLGYFGYGYKTVVVDGRNYPDALSGVCFSVSRSAEHNASPILLMAPGREQQTCDFIEEWTSNDVYVLGGEAAVSEKFLEMVPDIWNPITAKGTRISGVNRYDTNLKVLYEGVFNSGSVMICSGKDYADALSASAVGHPVMLVGDTLLDSQIEWLKEYVNKKVYIIGGEGAVSREIEDELKARSFSVTRIAGKDRYATSWKIADLFFIGADDAILACGNDFADALSAGPLAYSIHAPILLINSPFKYDLAKNFILNSWAPVTNVYVMGGEGAISDDLVKRVLNPKPY